MKYTIIDIETTGGKAIRDKITEIAIVLHDGRQIIDTYQTLINPETYIPHGITQLTGITQEMVQNAPRFYEIAKEIVQRTENAVFVAHNVRFDYGFVKEEFARLGYTFSRKQLCTVRLSRAAFPGLASYSLGNLIQHFGIRTEARHRALADAMATAELFERIMQQQLGAEQARQFINLGIKESRLPQNFNIEKIHALPEECGVYYLHDAAGNVVYVGKSINIRKRVAEHFADPTEKARKLQQRVHDVSYEITGSELVALLLESHEIKRLQPPVNRAQRVQQFPYAIHTWMDEVGYLRFDVACVTAKTRVGLRIVSEYPKLGNAKGHLTAKVLQYELCHRLSGLQNGKGACFQYHLHQCHGACAAHESPDAYNARAREALAALSTVFDQDFIIIDRGRHPNERALILVEKGAYCGYGYLHYDEPIYNSNELRHCIQYYSSNPETTRIVQRFLSENSKVEIVKI